MSLTSATLRKTRIIAVPLARPTLATSPLNNTHDGVLTYYQFQLSERKRKKETKETDTKATKTTLIQRWLPEGGLSRWVQDKAANTWASFGKAEGGWKLKTFQAGERMIDRLEFEELALKSIDPSLGPSITHLTSNSVLNEKEGILQPFKIPLLYPPSITSGEAAVARLRQYVDHRIPTHRKGFLTWIFIAPLTAPFMIIPIIPNLPFFFCVWRSWSHYKAYRSSQYLQSLLDHQVIVPEENHELDSLYQSHPNTTQVEVTDSTKPEDKRELLLSKDAIPLIVERFALGAHANADLYRAMEQARARVQGKA